MTRRLPKNESWNAFRHNGLPKIALWIEKNPMPRAERPPPNGLLMAVEIKVAQIWLDEAAKGELIVDEIDQGAFAAGFSKVCKDAPSVGLE